MKRTLGLFIVQLEYVISSIKISGRRGMGMKNWLALLLMTIIGCGFSQDVRAMSFSISDIGAGQYYFDYTGQVVEGSRNSPDWDDTPYDESEILNLLNTHFAPDYEFGSRWDYVDLFDINADLQGVGRIVYSSVDYGFFIDNSKISIFGAWSIGLGINNSGQIVGESLTGTYGPFLIDDSMLVDIHDYIPQTGSVYFSSLDIPFSDINIVFQASEWETIGAALDINDIGQILGVGRIDGESHSYLLTPNAPPVPEPATMLLLGSGLAGLIGFRKKFKK